MKTFYLLLLTLISQLALAQNEFITRWNLATNGSANTQISFGVGTAGTVNYTWQEVSPGTASGSGTFTGSTATIAGLPAGSVIDLKINPTDFHGFFINNGSDKNRLLDVGQWGTASWTSMAQAFYGCGNLQISATDYPDLTGVTSMAAMFRNCTVLNGPVNIGEWNTKNVTDMNLLFGSARAFNQPVGTWDTGEVTNMSGMFRSAIAFNQPISNWNTSSVTNMSGLFSSAIAFNNHLGDWVLNATVDLTDMLNGSGLDCYHYSTTLIGWSANPATPSGRSLGAGDKSYGTNAVAVRNNLVTTKGWTIIGDAPSGTDCSSALPVTLVSFSGKKTAENQNLLKWITADEKDFDRFEVQRSIDARSFETIGIGVGQRMDGQALTTYEFTDFLPGTFNYYRLKMRDKDDSFEYSRIISIANSAEQAVVGSFYPNPSNGKVFVDVYAVESGSWTLTVIDAAGRAIDRQVHDLQKGMNKISLSRLKPGVNLVRFGNGQFSEVRKLIRE